MWDCNQHRPGGTLETKRWKASANYYVFDNVTSGINHDGLPWKVRKEQNSSPPGLRRRDAALQQQAADRVYPGECRREIPHLESGR